MLAHVRERLLADAEQHHVERGAQWPQRPADTETRADSDLRSGPLGDPAQRAGQVPRGQLGRRERADQPPRVRQVLPCRLRGQLKLPAGGGRARVRQAHVQQAHVQQARVRRGHVRLDQVRRVRRASRASRSRRPTPNRDEMHSRTNTSRTPANHRRTSNNCDLARRTARSQPSSRCQLQRGSLRVRQLV